MKRTVCVSVAATTTGAVIEEVERVASSSPIAAAVEVRLDAVAGPDPEAIARAARPDGIELLLTCRAGGTVETTGDRMELLRRGVQVGAELVDIDAVDAPAFRELLAARGPADAKLIVSEHDFERTPDDAGLQRTLERLGALAHGPDDRVKLATRVAGAEDALRLLLAGRAFASSSGRPTIAVGMGEAGLATRVLAPIFGQPFTYAAADATRRTAPGQPTVDELATRWRHGELHLETAIYGVIGKPIGHSLSPAIHAASFAALGIDAVYLPFEVDDAPVFLALAARAGIAGLSVTAPHKLAALAAAREEAGGAGREDAAARVGAANTLRLDGGCWRATNTDAAAARESIEAALGGAVAGRAVCVLGAGGAARAAATELRRAGAEVTLRNRSATRGREAAEAAGVAFVGPLDGLAAGEAEVIVNATTLGQGEHVGESPVPASALDARSLVFDMVYRPRPTRLLREAAAAGAATLDGLDMLLRQAAGQVRFWTGREGPLPAMRAAAEAELAGGE